MGEVGALTFGIVRAVHDGTVASSLTWSSSSSMSSRIPLEEKSGEKKNFPATRSITRDKPHPTIFRESLPATPPKKTVYSQAHSHPTQSRELSLN